MGKRIKKYLGVLILVVLIFYTMSFGFFAYYRFPLLLPRDGTLLFVKRLIQDRLFTEALLTSILLGIVVGMLATGIGFMASLSMARIKKYRLQMTLLYSLPLFIPNMALFIGAHRMMMHLGLNNRFMGVVCGHLLIALPYSMNIAIGFYDGLDRMFGDASRTLGAGRIETCIRIWLPLLRPGLLLSFSLGFLLSFSEYFSTFLIGGGQVISFTMLYYPALNNADMGKSSLYSGLFVLIHLILFMMVNHYQKKTAAKDVLYNYG